MFSPYYAWARRRGRGDPLDHVALNVALYGHAGKRWCLTERSGAALTRDAATLSIGPSRLHWDGSALIIDIDEVTVPWPSRVKGRVRVEPRATVADTFALDAAGRHHWRPIAPVSRVEVTLERPALRWCGEGYLDTNSGSEPLEDAFVRWDWSRASGRGGARILYDVTRRGPEASDFSLALAISPDGRVSPLAAPGRAALPSTLWRIARGTRSEADHPARIMATLEDTPFYARSLVSLQLGGERLLAMHESLDLDRFKSSIVQLMLPFRMPRVRR